MRRSLIPLLILLMFTASARAEEERPYLEISDPNFRAYPLAIPEFKDLGQGSGAAAAAKGMETLRFDLGMTGVFKLLDPLSFLVKPDQEGLTGATINFANWINVGAEGLIVRYEADEDLFKEMRRRDEVTYYDDEAQQERTRIEYNRFTSERLGGVFGAAPNRFVAVGNNGTILQYDGNGWSKFTITGFVRHLNGVWGRSAGEVFAVGLEGTVLRGSIGGNWRQLNLDPKPPPVYLRSLWAFYQSKCGPPREVPDAESVPTDTSWVLFAGWDGTLLLAHDGLVCEMEDVTGTRLEGIWGIAPRPEAQRTDEDGNVECDVVEVVAVGVNGEVIRLVDKGERDL